VSPFNTTLTPGGSSGGESALIALRGSVMGCGTDIGGSIVRIHIYIRVLCLADEKSEQRVPAAHCGLYGLKVCSLIFYIMLPLSEIHTGLQRSTSACWTDGLT
jgi:hypothetical protein